MKTTEPLREGEDFYMENGLFVLTESYHRKRGHCCGNRCRHCPYAHANVPKPTDDAPRPTRKPD